MTRLHLAFASVLALSLAPVLAHAADAPNAPVAAAPSPAESKMQRRADHIEGHIAYLKAELMITPAQEADWAKVADQMRNAITDYEDAVSKLPPSITSDTGTPSAIDSLTERATFATLKAKGENNFLDAFKPLYASFSDQQKQIADDLFVSTANAENKNK